MNNFLNIFLSLLFYYAGTVLSYGQGSSDGFACVQYNGDMAKLSAFDFENNPLLKINGNNICTDWLSFQSSNNSTHINAVYELMATIDENVNDGVYSRPVLSFPFLEDLYTGNREFLRNPSGEQNLSDVLMMPFFEAGFLSLGSFTQRQKLDIEDAVYFPNSEVLMRHKEMGILRAYEMLANRQVVGSKLFMSNVVSGNYENVERETYQYFKKNSNKYAHSAFISGLYEVWNRDPNAISSIESAAKLGNEDAMLWLGMAYLDGIHISQDLVLAKKWLENANVNGSVQAKATLSLAYKFGTFGDFDVEKSHGLMSDYIQEMEKFGADYQSEYRTQDDYILLSYLTQVDSLNNNSLEYLSLERGAENGLLGAVEALCLVSMYGKQLMSKAFIQNLKNNNIINVDKAKKWCETGVRLGGKLSVTSMKRLSMKLESEINGVRVN